MIKDIEKNRIKLEDLIPKKPLTKVDKEMVENLRQTNHSLYKSFEKEAMAFGDDKTWLECHGKKLGITYETFCDNDIERIIYGLYMKSQVIKQ